MKRRKMLAFLEYLFWWMRNFVTRFLWGQVPIILCPFDQRNTRDYDTSDKFYFFGSPFFTLSWALRYTSEQQSRKRSIHRTLSISISPAIWLAY